MPDHQGVDAVASGAPYRVESVNGRPAGDLDALLADDVIEITVAHAGQQVIIQGSARRTDDQTVVVHEKADDGIGKDVRTWTVTATTDGLEAVERSAF